MKRIYFFIKLIFVVNCIAKINKLFFFNLMNASDYSFDNFSIIQLDNE